MEEGEMITYFIITAVVIWLAVSLVSLRKIGNENMELRYRLAAAESQAKAIARERDDLLGKLSDVDAARVASAREWPEILDAK